MLFRKAFSSGSTAWSLDSQADVATTIIIGSPISSPSAAHQQHHQQEPSVCPPGDPFRWWRQHGRQRHR